MPSSICAPWQPFGSVVVTMTKLQLDFDCLRIHNFVSCSLHKSLAKPKVYNVAIERCILEKYVVEIEYSKQHKLPRRGLVIAALTPSQVTKKTVGVRAQGYSTVLIHVRVHAAACCTCTCRYAFTIHN